MNLLSSLIYGTNYGLEDPPYIRRVATGLSRACNALGLEEAATHGGAVEALTSRRQEWRKKSTFCRPKGILKARLCACSACVIALEYGRASALCLPGWLPTANSFGENWPISACCPGKGLPAEQLQERMAQAGEQLDGNIR